MANRGKPREPDAPFDTDQKIRFYNFYNENHDSSDFYEWAVQYDESLRGIPQYEFSSTIGAICRMVHRGMEISPQQQRYLENKIQSLKDQYKQPSDNDNKQEEKKERQIHDFSADVIAEIDLAIDSEENVSVVGLLKKHNVNKRDAKKVGEYVSKLYNEFDELIEEKPDDLVEGYSNLGGVRQWKKIRNQYQQWLSEIDGYIGQKTKTRKPRKTKKPSVQKQIQKVSVKMEDSEFQLKGVDPQKIVGANVCWIFDTQYRDLIRLESKKGFTIRGTTIYDWDSSEKKKLRKPKEVLNQMTGSKACQTAFDGVKAKAQNANGRLHDKKIVLRVF